MSRFIVRKPKPRKSPEDSFQSKLISELTWRLRPEVIVAAIPNGGFRHRRTAAILRATGVKKGMTDLVFAFEKGQTAWLELKTSKVPLSDAQMGIEYRLLKMGHRHAVARTLDEALSQLALWGLLKKTPNLLYGGRDRGPTPPFPGLKKAVPKSFTPKKKDT